MGQEAVDAREDCIHGQPTVEKRVAYLT
jgi:hypothetical protein